MSESVLHSWDIPAHNLLPRESPSGCPIQSDTGDLNTTLHFLTSRIQD